METSERESKEQLGTGIETAAESAKLEEKRTSQGPDVTIDPKTAAKEDDSDGSKSKGEESDKGGVDINPEAIIASLTEKDEKEPAKGNFDKGLQKVQMAVSDIARQMKETQALQLEIAKLIAQAPDRKMPDKDDVSILEGLSNEDLVDGKTVKQLLGIMQAQSKKDLKDLAADLKNHQDQLAAQSRQSQPTLSQQDREKVVADMFPDLADPRFVRHILQQAGPNMEMFSQQNPNASQGFRDMAAEKFLGDEAAILRTNIAARTAVPQTKDSDNGSSNGSKTKKSQASTKIVDDSASPVTTTNTDGQGPMLTMQDAKDKWCRG